MTRVITEQLSADRPRLNEAIVLDGAWPDVALMKTKPCVTCQPATINYMLICTHTPTPTRSHQHFINTIFAVFPDRCKTLVVLNSEAVHLFSYKIVVLSVNLANGD